MRPAEFADFAVSINFLPLPLPNHYHGGDRQKMWKRKGLRLTVGKAGGDAAIIFHLLHSTANQVEHLYNDRWALQRNRTSSAVLGISNFPILDLALP